MLKLERRAVTQPLPTRGLHPLVMPIARAEPDGAGVLGLLRWPLGKSQTEWVVKTHPQGTDNGRANPIESLTVRPLGSVAQFTRRIAVETDAKGDNEDLVRLASDACVEAGGTAYEVGSFEDSKLSLPQFILLKAGMAFPDVWTELARRQLARGDETAALVAAERGSANNPGWGCCLWEQAKLMDELGRAEERRDLALAALEARRSRPSMMHAAWHLSRVARPTVLPSLRLWESRCS